MQQTNPLRVLMLGWEYPPIVAGGLGMACYGLTKALSQYVHITLILPRKEIVMPTPSHVDIIGLNTIGLAPEATPTNPICYEEITQEVYYAAAPDDLNPYPVSIGYTEIVQPEALPFTDFSQVRALYNTPEPYGANIMEKVATYTEIVTQLAADKQFDVIHAHDWITYPAAMQIHEATGKPLFLHVHSLETDRIGTQAKYEYGLNAVYDIERQAMHKATLIFPVSNYTKQCAMAHYDVPTDKFRVVYNGIDAHTFPTRSGNNHSTKEKTVLFLGRITYQKGPVFMAETAMKVLQKYQNVRFVVAGIGDKLDELKQITETCGIADRFVFTGFLPKEKVAEVLAETDVYFMPSVSEPFGLSALEAVQAGIPSVLSRQSGVAEVLPHTLQADYSDTDRFANYIYALLNYGALRMELSRASAADANQLSWKRAAYNVLRAYAEVLS
ncbi:hypothetical protein SAMN05421780_10642 [Flexibacter flexilis DSM 6793]|uniref:Uncharacterized protein n=1 Tax=Flexibacter flexilis DSM 6793 TaxID=927664 RepID=A0A1I1JRZ2_9BACT|nr:glycosyltransferase [Flexibacter flexilis]SFC49288.1 hypothetical protein SAMN05421780_10642 [Flexibacter flexilis DSM 6793]